LPSRSASAALSFADTGLLIAANRVTTQITATLVLWERMN
jgi:hypothetical protein